MGTSAIHHFLRQASTEEQLCLQTDTHTRTHTHTEQSQAQNLFQIFPWARPEPGLFQTLGWTWTRLCDNIFCHRDPQIISGAKSKPGLMSDFAGNVHSQAGSELQGFWRKSGEGSYQQCSPSPQRFPKKLPEHGAGNGSSYISTCQLLSGWVLLASVVCVLVIPFIPSSALVSK